MIVGVNEYADEHAEPVPTLVIDSRVAEQQMARVVEVRKRRDPAAAARALASLENAAREATNVMPALIDGARAYATVGEMMRRAPQGLGRVRGSAVDLRK